MGLYMATHKKQRLSDGEWFYSNEPSNYTMFVVANNDEEAMEKVELALAKINSKTKENTRYVLSTPPRDIIAISVEHSINGTNVIGIWD